MKPPIQYFGAKGAIAQRIVDLMPEHEAYIEPYAGSLSVLLAKPPAKIEVANDLDHRLVNFWRVLRDRGDELIALADLTPHSREELDRAIPLDADTELEQARQVWVMLTQGRSRTLKRTGWRFYADPRGTSSAFATTYMDAYRARLGPALDRIRGVSLECRPALEIIEQYGAFETNLLYVDPPYLGSTRRGGRYSHEMAADRDHHELADALHACKAKVMLSGYLSPVYESLFGHWHQVQLQAASGNATDTARVEVLWMNYEPENVLDFGALA